MKPLRLKGHRLELDRRGPNDAYAYGCCECRGWHFLGWSTKVRDVRADHQQHLSRVARGIPEARRG